ncbi:MAG: hypothetical protein ACTSQF_10225 [Candidatus Heimdallarchaeaceae archaeon]
MHYAVLFLYLFFPLEILLIGIVALLTSGLLSNKITQRFPYLKSKMRLIYGYIVIICSTVSMIVFWYIYSPFEMIWTSYFNTQISPFSAGTFYAIGIATIIVSFITMAEIGLDTTKSYLLFISLLLFESSSWFILASDSWINIFFGFILIFTAANLFLRGLYDKRSQENQSVLTNFLVMSSLSLSLLFVGIACHSFSGSNFNLTILDTTRNLWEYVGISFILVSLLILMGVPPFHNWFFKTEDRKLNSSSFVLLILQRGLALMFLVRYLSIISESKLNVFLPWLFTSLGLLYALWGALGSITERSLQKLLYYISLLYIGIIFLILSDIFSTTISQENLVNSMKSVNFGVLVYVIIFTFSFSLFSSISKGFKTDEIEILGSIGHNSISQFLVNLFNIVLIFVIPISLFLISKKYIFSSTFTPRMYLASISFIIILVMSLIYFLRMLKALIGSQTRHKIQLIRIEPATIISSVLMCIVIISILILVIQFIEFCTLISSFLIS